MKRLLIVGGGGFVGSRLARLAVARDVAVGVFGPAGGPDLLAGLDGLARCSGAAEAPGALRGAIEAFRPDAVVWAAGHNPTGDGLARTADDDVARAVAVNAGGFAALLAACAAAGVTRVVQCGSTVVYGPAAAYAPQRVDETAPAAPRSAYGMSKRLAEAAAEWGATALGLDVTTLRLPLVTGPGRWYVGAAGAFARLVDAAARDGTVREDVPAWAFDTVHADDAADILLRLAKRRDGPRVLNLAGLTTTHAAIAATLRQLAPRARIAVTERAAPVPLPLVDDSLLRRTLDWAPGHDLRSILADAMRDAAVRGEA